MKKILLLFQINHSVRWVLQGGHYNLIPNRHWNVRASAPVRRHIVLKSIHTERKRRRNAFKRIRIFISFENEASPGISNVFAFSQRVSEPLDLLVLRCTFSDFRQRSTFWLELSSVFLERPNTRVELIPLALHSIHCLFVLFYRVKTVQISHWLRYC